MNCAARLRLLLIADGEAMGNRDWLATCRAAVAGGVTAVQVRAKQMQAGEQVELVRHLIAGLDVPVMVNDRLDVALAAGAWGVHLGVEDLPVQLARRICPSDFVIGASVGTDDEVTHGVGADYWGVGPYRATASKSDAGSAIGLDGAATILRRAGDIPAVAIGGVRPGDCAELVSAGFAGAAILSGILAAPDTEAAAREYALALA